MLQHLVVALDATAGPTATTQWAIALAAGTSARVTFVDTRRDDQDGDEQDGDEQHGDEQHGDEQHGDDRHGGDREADDLLRQAARAVTGTRIARLHRPGEPVRTAARVAGELGADLIVAAAPHTRPDPGPAPTPSNGDRPPVTTLLDGGIPVAVVPDGSPAPDARAEWVVAVDDTEAGERALQWTRWIADHLGGRITVVLATDGGDPARPRPGDVEHRAHIDVAGDRLRRLLVAPHDGGEALRRTADESPRPTVIVAGTTSRHLSRTDTPADPDAPERFVTTVCCPVVLIPTGDDPGRPAARRLGPGA